MSKKQEQQGQSKAGMARLFQLAMMKKPLVIGAVILSSLASILSFVPYLAIYMVIRALLNVLPDFSALDSRSVISWGMIAFAGVGGNILLYFGALVCAHLGAFGTLYELKLNFASHLTKLPLGYLGLIGSGKLRKIMDKNIEKVEGFIAHQLPDMAAALVAPIAMLVIMLVVDWRCVEEN